VENEASSLAVVLDLDPELIPEIPPFQKRSTTIPPLSRCPK
jgi:hypothetical protein